MLPSPISGPSPIPPAAAFEPAADFDAGRNSGALAVAPPSESQDTASGRETGGDDQAAAGDRTLSAAVDAALASKERRDAGKAADVSAGDAADDAARDAMQRIQQETAQKGYEAAREATGLPGQSSSE